MPYVKEYSITSEDVKRYGLAEIDTKFRIGAVGPRSWVIDRQRDSYLRLVTRGREEESAISGWTFYWEGFLITLKLESLGVTKEAEGRRRVRYRLRDIVVPDQLIDSRDRMLATLKEALLANGFGETYPSGVQYSVDLQM